MSSFIKCYLPVYDSNEGRTNSMFAFRLYRNEVIMFKHDNVELITINHFRGIEESAKIFALLIIAEYVAICSSQGVDFYSITGH